MNIATHFKSDFRRSKQGERRMFGLGILCFLGFLLFIPLVRAQQKITASITVTNGTTNGMTFTLNGDTRTWTNNVVNSAAQVLTNSDATGCGAKTNLLNQIYAAPFAGVVAVNVGSNSFRLIGNGNLAMNLSYTAGYLSASYSTQTVSSVIVVQGPQTALPTAMARTNNSSAAVSAVNGVEATNTLSQAAPAMAELVGTTNFQTISGQKTFNNTNGYWAGLVTSLAITGNSVKLTNGLYFTPILISPILTNAVNYGNAFSSPGQGASSEQFGYGSQATNSASTAVGPGALANGALTLAIGFEAEADGFHSTAVGSTSLATATADSAFGFAANASGGGSTAIGLYANASGSNSTAIGFQSNSHFVNSTAVGALSTNTADYQLMLGAPGISTIVQNNLNVQTNLGIGGNFVVSGNAALQGIQTNGAFKGTNNYLQGADVAFARFPVTTLANGANAAVPIGTNVFIEVSGPSGSFSIDGIANGRDGKWITLVNQTGFQMTIANESGSDPAPANRIRTLGSAANIVLTNAAVTLFYNGNVSRWLVISHNP